MDMTTMNRVIEIGPDTVTAEAGALYIDVARELLRHRLQFYVNVELGNLTVGSAACGGTKDASMPGEFGQVSSYVIGMKVVTPSFVARRLSTCNEYFQVCFFLHPLYSSWGSRTLGSNI